MLSAATSQGVGNAELQNRFIQLWYEFSLQASPKQLMGLLFVANDVLWRLWQPVDRQYKYMFLPAIGHCLSTVYRTAPGILPDTWRLLSIWKQKHIFDNQAIHLLTLAFGGRDVTTKLQEHMLEQHNDFSSMTESNQEKHTGRKDGDVCGEGNTTNQYYRENEEFCNGLKLLLKKVEKVQANISDKAERRLGKEREIELLRGGTGAANQLSVCRQQAVLLQKKEWRLRSVLSELQLDVQKMLVERNETLLKRLASINTLTTKIASFDDLTEPSV